MAHFSTVLTQQLCPPAWYIFSLPFTPYPLSVMLRVHLVQVCHNLSDPAMEDLLYDSEAVRRFVGLGLSGSIPDESTILHFRHLLERHQLGQGLFEEIKASLGEQGMLLKEGTIVDATIQPTIIQVPSSPKSREGQRDPEMRQVRKGRQYYFGMKLHIGVDAETGMVHSMETTPAHVHDVTQAGKLLHGAERRVWGDAGYIGVQKRKENLGLEVDWRVAMKPGKRRMLARGGLEEWAERNKASIRARVEHPLPGDETALWLCQDKVPGPGQEHGTSGPAAGAVQLETGTNLAGWLTQGVVRLPGPDHRKSGPGRVTRAPKAGPSTGADPPQEAAKAQYMHKCQFFRGSLIDSCTCVL